MIRKALSGKEEEAFLFLNALSWAERDPSVRLQSSRELYLLSGKNIAFMEGTGPEEDARKLLGENMWLKLVLPSSLCPTLFGGKGSSYAMLGIEGTIGYDGKYDARMLSSRKDYEKHYDFLKKIKEFRSGSFTFGKKEYVENELMLKESTAHRFIASIFSEDGGIISSVTYANGILFTIATIEKYRGMGYARAAIGFALENASRLFPDKKFSVLLTDDERNMEFYKHIGFHHITEIRTIKYNSFA